MFLSLEMVTQFLKQKTAEERASAVRYDIAAWCYYDNDPKNGEIYGKLYNSYAINDPRGLAPLGWHIPTDSEQTTLDEYLGDTNGGKMKAKSGWNNSANGLNSCGFSALPGGIRYDNSNFEGMGVVVQLMFIQEMSISEEQVIHFSIFIQTTTD